MFAYLKLNALIRIEDTYKKIIMVWNLNQFVSTISLTETIQFVLVSWHNLEDNF